MFVVGTFVTIISIVRLASLVQFRSSSNLTYDYAGTSLWSTVEVAIGIMCACMPSMRLILVRIYPKIFGSTAKSSRNGYNSQGYPHNNTTSGAVTSSKNRSTAQGSWKPRFSKKGSGVHGGAGGMERIDSMDDVMELRSGGGVKTEISSSRTSDSDDGVHRVKEAQGGIGVVTVTRDITMR